MIGDRLQRIARRLVRDETHTMIVVPAIADLQLEASGGWYSRVRGYVGVWRAIVGGLVDEVRSDAAHTFTRSRMPRVFSVVCATLAVIIAVHLWFFSWNWGFRPQDEGLLFLLLLPSLVASAWPALMLPAAATLAKRGGKGTARSITLAACMSAMMMLACLDYGVTRANQYFRQLSYELQGGTGVVQPGPNELPVYDLASRDDRQSRIALHFRLALCASGIGWALMGVSLARLRTVVLVAVGVVAYGVELMPIPLVTSGIRALKMPVWSPWLPTIVLLVLGIAALRANQRNPRTAEPTN